MWLRRQHMKKYEANKFQFSIAIDQWKIYLRRRGSCTHASHPLATPLISYDRHLMLTICLILKVTAVCMESSWQPCQRTLTSLFWGGAKSYTPCCTSGIKRRGRGLVLLLQLASSIYHIIRLSAIYALSVIIDKHFSKPATRVWSTTLPSNINESIETDQFLTCSSWLLKRCSSCSHVIIALNFQKRKPAREDGEETINSQRQTKYSTNHATFWHQMTLRGWVHF